MFTGIIEEVGIVSEVLAGRLSIQCSFAHTMDLGQSVSVNGACLTVTGSVEHSFVVNAVPETLRKTNLGQLDAGSGVNLERAMPADGRFEGHIVQGHVDGTCKITDLHREGEDRLYTMESPPAYLKYLIPRGSITLDGISLTIARLEPPKFTVAIIPYTHEHTTAREWRVGTVLNMECDAIGKYVAHYLATWGPQKDH